MKNDFLKRILIISAAVILAVCTFPAGAVRAEEGELSLGGTVLPGGYYYDCTDGSVTETAPSGGWAYYDGEGTLTLNGYLGPDVYAPFDLTVSVSGSCEIGEKDYPVLEGICVENNDLTIEGNGSLNIYFTDEGLDLYQEGTLNVTSGSIRLICAGKGNNDTFVTCGGFSMSGGKLTCESRDGIMIDGISCDGDFDLSGGELTVILTADNINTAGIFCWGDLSISGGKLSIDSRGTGLTAESLEISGGEHDIRSGYTAVEVVNGTPVFSGGTTHMAGEEMAINSVRFIEITNGEYIKENGYCVQGVYVLIASLIEPDTDGFWSIFPSSLDPDVTEGAARKLAVKDTTITDRVDNPDTFHGGYGIVTILATAFALAVMALVLRKRRNA